MEPLDSQPPQGRSRGRLAVVSGYAHDPLTPRGQRTQRLLERLAEEWEIELVALPAETFGPGAPAGSRRPRWRRVASRAADATLLDRWEPWSARRLARWRPQADAALLIAYPWSPVTYAARRLRRAGIPYVLDAGDPWGLTAPVPIGGRLSRGRWRRAERALWSNAVGAVVTTGRQADVLTGFFPDLPVLVRANGYEPPASQAEPPVAPGGSDRGHLRLVHYGSLPSQRVDPNRLLEVLVASRRWETIRLTQFGEDYVDTLARAPGEVEIEWRAPLPWSEVIAAAGEFDLAIAIGNVLPGQLPSKAVQYMTLPIPRLAVTASRDGDSLAEYVREKPGWAAAAWDDPAADRVVAEHLARDWSPAALAPPPEESWPAVAERIAGFVSARLTAAPDRPAVAYATAQTEASRWSG